MKLFGKPQTPAQPGTQAAQPPVPPPAQAQPANAASGAPAAKPLPRAKRGFRGIWANPEKCDTSDWNTYYFYYRQVAQHGSLKLKQLKWIALAANLYFFAHIAILVFIQIKAAHADGGPGYAHIDLDALASSLIPFIMSTVAMVIFLVLALVPMIMVTQAFKIRERNRGLMTSRAKDPPLLLHLLEYTSGKGLITGVMQSLAYTYARLLVYMSPALVVLVGTFVATLVMFPLIHALAGAIPSVRIALAVLMGSTAWVCFLTMQSFCFRLDTLCFIIMFTLEIIWDFIYAGKTGMIVGAFIGRSFLFVPVMWAACMAFFPLAASDTLEYGIGKHARYIRFLLLGIVAFNLLWLALWRASLDPNLSMKGFTESIILPGLWILVGLFGLVESSISAASYRAKNVFRLHAAAAKGNLLSVRFFDPASPASAIPVIVLEIAVTAAFVVLSRAPVLSSFSLLSRMADDGWTPPVMVYFGVLILSSAHFALFFITFSRRHTHKEKKPWQTHPNFSGLFFLIFAIFMIAWMFSGGNLVIPFFTLVMAAMASFILWEPVNEQGESAPAQQPPPASFGRDPQ